DGGDAMRHQGAPSSTDYTLLLLLCQQGKDAPPGEPGKTVRFVARPPRAGGGVVRPGPQPPTGTHPPPPPLATLTIPSPIDEETRRGALDFLADRQTDEGGFAANTRIPFADVLSSFTATLTLLDLGGLEEVDAGDVRRFVQSLEADAGGFLAHAIDEVPDVE